jgi:nucleotide-binding universal stress UspA family protein
LVITDAIAVMWVDTLLSTRSRAHRLLSMASALRCLAVFRALEERTSGECDDRDSTNSLSGRLLGPLPACARFVAAEAASGVAIETVLREGNTAAEILDQAARMNADLLVIGTHGRSGFERLVLGSVAEKVLRKASCPVLTVPRRLPDAAPAGPVLYKRILCPIDFSDSSLHALQYAISMAQEADGRLTVLHVVAHELENTADLAGIGYDTGLSVGDFLKQREEALRRRLQEAPSGFKEFCSVESLMTHGKPWREVLRIATEQHSDLIVMGVQGRGAADLLFFGSTTQHVVREATCPVLTLRRG